MNWVMQIMSIVSLCLQHCTPIFTLIGNDYFWSCHTNFVSKSCIEMLLLRFRGHLGEIESNSQTVWTCICNIGPRSVFPIFKS